MKTIPDPVDVHVGKRVRLRRMIVGMTQTDLGNALNITFQQVQKYEQGANRIGSSRIYRISKILGVPVSFFFDDMPNNITDNFAETLEQLENDINDNNMARKETLNLVRNYYSIDNEGVRRNLYNLVKSMSRDS